MVSYHHLQLTIVALAVALAIGGAMQMRPRWRRYSMMTSALLVAGISIVIFAYRLYLIRYFLIFN